MIAGPIRRNLSLGLLSAIALFVPPSRAQDAKTAEPTKNKWLPLLQRHAGEYTVVATRPDSKKVPAKVLPDVLMRWTQPVRGGDDGVLCLWTEAGRPAVVMSIFTFKYENGTRAIVHEHQSLSTMPLEGGWRGRSMWHTTRAGLTFEVVPDAPKPAAAPAARLRSMQAIARDFSANTIDRKNSTWPLRVLPKPLYRYQGTGPEILDGALFGLVQGNDPEAFLLLEARIEAAEPRWYYGLARLTDLELRVRFKDRQVFSAPMTNGQADEPYQTTTVLSKASDDPGDFESP